MAIKSPKPKSLKRSSATSPNHLAHVKAAAPLEPEESEVEQKHAMEPVKTVAATPILTDSLPEISEEEALQRARRMVIRATPAITAKLLEQALQGNYLYARMLFDFTGLTAGPAPAPQQQISPLVFLVAEHLGLSLDAFVAGLPVAGGVYTKAGG